ncbi:tyrosine-type recombinase/integrase [Ruminococcus albus]|uniref:Site-specific recombinase XerD n=1 Tax=Ruminococcus albus TaxID=1264 RepID=A0A1H7NGQ5_RUMAL|nr:tyrosine-type recombinase/integrase [Ruminococcus albus]SEL22195.1 Site-specific recombinase XerD [Ruminococcus albus]
MAERRKDSKGRVLKSGESERSDGTYMYRYTASNGKRHCVYDKTLEGLRKREDDISRNRADGIRTEATMVTVNDIYYMWLRLKKGLKDNTFQNYKYMYESFVEPDLGRYRIATLKHSDVLRFYNTLADERLLKANTIDNIHTVLHQVLDLAVQDNYLRTNPSNNALRHLKHARNFENEKKRALTREEQDIFLNYLSRNGKYHHWYPIFYIMLNTGMRVGEITGLRWEDVDLDGGFISVNHTLVYYNHKKNGCYFNIHTPKTKAGERTIPILNGVKEAFIQEEHYQREAEIQCAVTIDGYTDFVFVNRFGNVHNQGTLNKAIRRITRDCNEEIIVKSRGKANVTLLPRFSCHSLRHTFATRLCESGVNIKVIQDVLGHADFNTTMNVYTDATKDLKQREFKEFDRFLNNGGNEEE